MTQVWESALLFTSVSALYLFLRHRPSSEVLVAAVILAGFVSPALQMAYQWERAVLLRFGRFRGLAGSGLFAIVPVVDKVSNYVDQRIRVTDFSAETTLTRDTVPVNVDAIAFWMVWDAEKSVLEVEDFVDAVTLSAQTGLRDAIGKHELADMLSTATGWARRSSRCSTPRPTSGASPSSPSRSATSSSRRRSRTR